MAKPTGLEQRSRLDTARIHSLLQHLLRSTDTGLADNFLIHDATDLRWSVRARISGNKSQRHGVIVLPPFFFVPAERDASSRENISPYSTVSDFVSQNGG